MAGSPSSSPPGPTECSSSGASPRSKARPPIRYLARMYFDTVTFDPEMLRHMVNKYGPGHVLLGTDYPYDMGEENALALIRSVRGIKRDERDMVEGGNAARLLKIKRLPKE